ncbi:DUF4062 domain-containing protein [Shewanella sp. MMG014]|uniref:DUF4062 domain-containing protein n=1 Tax=Shewanella sp. MMG014 TaxID=2822691 RepID=UPI001B365B0B|nr:DUF4062 domain-containing protein [Shewanella sp. MMG014]MBQ4891754.1 DUF4062 domain-containing protein [Shewanella sp. MMG014]
MAVPKVFVSSTCYDLAEERSQLERFIISYGFQPILSEYSDVFYDPDEHTHNACVKEVAHCDLFILIISGRFGGKHIDGDGESITQAEYNEARRLKIPIFSFVKNDVLNAQLYFKENVKSEGKEFATRIKYPSIYKQDDAVKIFEFIQSVQHARENNAIESYVSFSDIEEHLRKQWAAQFYKFLEDRKSRLDVEHISIILDKLSGSSNKLESLVESLHDNNQGKDKTQELLHNASIFKNIEDFWQAVKELFDLYISVYTREENEYNDEKLKLEQFNLPDFARNNVQNWSDFDPVKVSDYKEYLTLLGIFNFEEQEERSFIKVSIIGLEGLPISFSPGTWENRPFEPSFELGIKGSNAELRKKALVSVFGKS